MINNQFRVDSVIRTALEEDLGSGDITTDAIIDPDSKGKAILETREQVVLAGLPVFCRAFELIGPEIKFETFYEDGELVETGETICNISGSLSVILKAERTALNFLQRMSGIATLTREYVSMAGSDNVRILDTRKTAPGLNLFDKYSVRMGGGFNHRFGLYDGILIKDNHITAAGSVAEAVNLAKKNSPHTVRVEVEVEDLAGVEEAVKAGADAILLDNMTYTEIREAVHLIAGKILVEASGGITLENINEIARTGVDLISVGALTHSVRAVDLSLELIARDS
ncbi:carboxylating nicotinate-nucleotide diphosphorylase [Deltaproteobacteria bacterium]|nr:carboxylating nicotinate-nucleotide diphosphorylase [Deltaproteobacteria bacterium]